MTTHWSERLQSSTRGQILEMLRRRSRTVTELASALGVSGNAVRAHLASLERDKLITQRGVRRRIGKPAFVYELTPQGEGLFPKAYSAVLKVLLGVLGERLGPEALEQVLAETGRRAAADSKADPSMDLRERVVRALEVLSALGGLAEIEEGDGVLRIQGYRCPLAEVVPSHPETCILGQALLTELVGKPVRELCEKGDAPRCIFEISLNGKH